MPQTISLYKLFLASPSDVKEERLIVESIINDFNNTYSSQLNYVVGKNRVILLSVNILKL